MPVQSSAHYMKIKLVAADSVQRFKPLIRFNLGFDSTENLWFAGVITAWTKQGLAPKYICDLVQKPISSLSSHPLQSSDHLDLLVPQTRAALTQNHAFASMGPSMWNDLPPAICTKTLTGLPPYFFRCLKTFLFSLGLPRWERLWITSSVRGTLQTLN